jgi:hypothetical protein
MNSYLLSGAIAGIVGLATFLVIHHFWIQPIWFIFLPGLILSSIGGIAVGWSFQTIQSGLPAYPWSFLGLSLVILLVLLPGFLIAEFTPAPFNLDGSLASGYTGWKAAGQFFLELILTSAIVGAGIGWFLAGTRAAVISTAVAGVVFALGPGHNIPFLGNTPGVSKGIALLLAIILISSFSLMLGVELIGQAGK